MTPACQPKGRKQWRAWLKRHHRSASEVWCVFFKAHAGVPSVSYDEAVEEALCFGWVDSIVRTIDADRYAQRFSPRKAGSRWSLSNIKRMKRMIAADKVVAAGRAAFAGHKQRRVAPHPAKLPGHLERRFSRSAKAWSKFRAFPPGYRRMAISWVASAKREETKRRRLDRLIEASARGARLSFI